MYESYKGGYPQEYDTVYTEETQGDNSSIYFDGYNTDSQMLMSQPRTSQSSIQYRNPNYQNYMPYPTNQPLMCHPYPPKHIVYPQHQRGIHPRTQTYPTQFIGGMHRHGQMGQYQQQQPLGQYVPRDTHEKMIRKYENVLRMLKAQNIAVIDKLRILMKRMYDQEKMVKDYILTGVINDTTEASQQKFMENFKSISNQYQQNNHNNIIEEYKQPDFQYEIYDQPLQSVQTELIQNKIEPIQTQPVIKQLQRDLNPDVQRILAQKIRKMAEKANDKVKTENVQKLNETIQTQPNQKPSQDSTTTQSKSKKAVTSISQTKSQKQQHYEDQDNLDPDQPMYPDDNEGQQSFLVDEEVQEKQRLKSLQKHPKANTFGILSPEVNDFSYRPVSKNPDLQRECQIIEQFFDTFLCQYISYAPRKDFFKNRINKVELYNIYIWWRHNNINNFELKFDKKTVQSKITTEIHRRYSSLQDERQSFAGIMFKNNDIIKMMKTPQVL